MKIEDLTRPSPFALGAIGLLGLAAAAAAGFAAGIAVGRDPQAAQRTMRRVAREAARGVEHAALLLAQAREHVGDLWAEAREEALAEVDAADFERAARGAANSAAGGRPRHAAAASVRPTAEAGDAAAEDEADMRVDPPPRGPVARKRTGSSGRARRDRTTRATASAVAAEPADASTAAMPGDSGQT